MEGGITDVEVSLGLGFGAKVHGEALVPAGSSAHPEAGATSSLVVPLGSPIGTEQKKIGTIAIGLKAGVEGQLGPLQVAAEAKAGAQSKAGVENSGYMGLKAEAKAVIGFGTAIMAKVGLFLWSLKN